MGSLPTQTRREFGIQGATVGRGLVSPQPPLVEFPTGWQEAASDPQLLSPRGSGSCHPLSSEPSDRSCFKATEARLL